jgi:hypothetical protein
LNVLPSACTITGSRATTRRNLQASGLATAGLRRLAAGVEIDYEVEAPNTNAATMSALLAASSAALESALADGGYTGVTAGKVTFTDISPTASPTSSPTALSPGGIAGVVIGVIVFVALLGALGYYMYFLQSQKNLDAAPGAADLDVIPSPNNLTTPL